MALFSPPSRRLFSSTTDGAAAPTPTQSLPPPSVRQRLRGLFLKAARGPSYAHSALFGICAGLAFYGGYIAYRGCRVLLFDTETPALRSRRRYAERQRLFMEGLSETLAAHHIAAYVAEYDPAAMRLPFQPLDDKWRL